MLGSGSSSKRQQEQAQGGSTTSEKRKKGNGGKEKTVPRRNMTKEEYTKWIKEGNGYAPGFTSADISRPQTIHDEDIPRGAPPEYRSHFIDIWMRYSLQMIATNGMDADTYPGPAGIGTTVPMDLKKAKKDEHKRIMDLAELAIEEYNEESNFFKYKLLKIEKLNYRVTDYCEYFMTVKVMNLTLGTVYETFQIHAGARMADASESVFSCLPKGGALPIAMEMEVSLNGKEMNDT